MAEIANILQIAGLIGLVILAFGFLIVFHELGHFAAAKWCGVAAPEFSFGMGKELFGITVGETRYKVCLLPIGGYVRMIGEEVDEETEKAYPPERNFRNKTTLQKMFIIFAGPAMNVVLAWLLYVALFMGWGLPRALNQDVDPRSDVVMYQTLKDEPAETAGLQNNDIVLAINGEKIVSVGQFRKITAANPGVPLTFHVQRNPAQLSIPDKIRAWLKKNATKTATATAQTQYLDIVVTPELEENADGSSRGMIGVIPGPGKGLIVPREIAAVTADSAAERAGLQKGDILLAVNGGAFDGKTELEGNPELTISRGDEEMTLSIPLPRPETIGALATFESMIQRPGVIEAAQRASQKIYSTTYEIFYFLKMLIFGKMSGAGVAGPVGIIKYTYQSAKAGFDALVAFTAFISINLAIINLVPIPALDGSRLAFLLWGAVSRKPLDPNREGIVHYVGFMFLMALMLFLVVKDILYPTPPIN